MAVVVTGFLAGVRTLGIQAASVGTTAEGTRANSAVALSTRIRLLSGADRHLSRDVPCLGFMQLMHGTARAGPGIRPGGRGASLLHGGSYAVARRQPPGTPANTIL